MWQEGSAWAAISALRHKHRGCQGVMHLLALVHVSTPHTALCAHCLLDPHAVL